MEIWFNMISCNFKTRTTVSKCSLLEAPASNFIPYNDMVNQPTTIADLIFKSNSQSREYSNIFMLTSKLEDYSHWFTTKRERNLPEREVPDGRLQSKGPECQPTSRLARGKAGMSTCLTGDFGRSTHGTLSLEIQNCYIN